MLNQFLLEKHTDSQGSIMVDDSHETLALTASLIRDDMPIEINMMADQLIESDEAYAFFKALVMQDVSEALKVFTVLTDMSEKNLIETIERLKRAA